MCGLISLEIFSSFQYLVIPHQGKSEYGSAQHAESEPRARRCTGAAQERLAQLCRRGVHPTAPGT
jgi:hypothetical protein